MDIKSNELFWSAGIDEVKKGYIETENDYRCIICDLKFPVHIVVQYGESTKVLNEDI